MAIGRSQLAAADTTRIWGGAPNNASLSSVIEIFYIVYGIVLAMAEWTAVVEAFEQHKTKM